jgi:hypothetical protein
MRKVLLIGVAAASLGACGRLGLGAVQSPHRKPGLWEMTLQSDRTPAPIVTRWCFDAASDRLMPVLGRRERRRGPLAAACAKMSVSKSGDSYVMDSQCSFGGATITNHQVISGDFNVRYAAVSTIHVQGSSDPARNGAHTLTQSWVYKGDCPAEVQPGQVECPDGSVMAMASMRRGGCGRGPFGGGAGAGGGPGARPGGGPPAGGPPAGGPPG